MVGRASDTLRLFYVFSISHLFSYDKPRNCFVPDTNNANIQRFRFGYNMTLTLKDLSGSAISYPRSGDRRVGNESVSALLIWNVNYSNTLRLTTIFYNIR